jgi:hapalindole H/12-epi-hapalindole U/12-epi-fischerindole U synthase
MILSSRKILGKVLPALELRRVMISGNFYLGTEMLSTFNQAIAIIVSSLGIVLGISTKINSAPATFIPLENAGFEIPIQLNELIPGAGFFDLETPPGWSLYDPNSLIPETPILGATSFSGGWRPSELFFPIIPEGEQIGSLFLVPPGAGEVGLTQNSNVAVQAQTRYTLSVAVLNTPSKPGFEVFAGFPGYRIELLAGDNVIAADDNTIVINEGEFQRVELSYTSSDNDFYLGQTLSIRLINLNRDDPNGNGIEVNFDDVQLTSTPVSVPEPTSILGYLILGLTLMPIRKWLTQR